MNPHVTRAQMLLSQSRPEMAEAELRRALEAEPQDSTVHALLGLCLLQLKRKDEARRELHEAIRLDPESSYPHYLTGLVHLDDEKIIDARRACDEALRLDPYQPSNHWLSAAILLKENKKQEAIDALDRGLSMDPQDVDCLNLRARILTQMGRSKEAAGTIARTLAAAPEDADTHATQGWAFLHTNKPREALKHFEEALRIEPGHPYARAGLVEALKARFLIYRLVLGFFLWMTRLDARVRTGLIIGAYIAYQLLRSVARNNEATRPITYTLIGLYVGFVLLTWVAVPLFNLTLRLNRHGWHALDRSDKTATDGFGLLLLAALVLTGLGAGLGMTSLYFWAGYLGIVAIVYHRVISTEAWRYANLMSITAGITILCGLTALIFMPYETEAAAAIVGLAGLAFWVGFLVFLFSGHSVRNRR